MHRFSCWPLLVGGMVIALIATAGPERAPGQEPSPQPSALIVPINGTVKLQMSKKQKIRTVTNPKENAINIRTVVGDPTTVLIIGQQPDVTRVELEDTEGNKETYEVIVQADIEYLRTQLKRAVPTANVTAIPTNDNTVILSGTVTRAEDVAIIRGVVQSIGFKYIDGMRVGGVQQVQLDVIIVEVSRSDLRNLTFNFLGSSRYAVGSNTVGNAVATPTTIGGPAGGAFSGGGGLLGTPSPTTNLMLGLVHNAWGFQNFLEALKQNNMAKLLAEPRLVTLSGRPASFLVGGQQAVPTSSGLGTIGIQFVPFGTQLNFIPIVLGNGRIHLEVMPEVSSLDQAAGTSLNGAPVAGRSTNMVNTTIELESGQTFVIGGLIQHDVQASVSKVPCLGDLPYFGAFFRSVQYQDKEQEVLVIVTPWLVDAQSCDQRPKLLPGEETRKPDNFELFLEGIIEAPRGPRQAYQNHHYVAPWKNSPSAAVFPCAGKGNCGVGGCYNGCGDGPPVSFGPSNPAAPMEAPATLMSAPPPAMPATPSMPVTPAAPTPVGAPVKPASAIEEPRLQAVPTPTAAAPPGMLETRMPVPAAGTTPGMFNDLSASTGAQH